MRKTCGIYAILMGVGLIGTWVVLLATGQAGQFLQTPLQTWSLLTAEFLTGTLLILGGWGILAHSSRGMAVHLVSLGMLQYVSIFSIGSFAQDGNLPAAAFFAAVAAATLAVILVQFVWAGGEIARRKPVHQ